MIPVFKPFFDETEINYLKPIFDSGWIGLGPKTREFEKKIAEYIGVKYAVGLNSATAALHLGLNCFNIENMEVITTPLTFVSTNHAIIYNKGIPVFCDVEQDTMNIDSNKIENLITKKTRGVIVVHYGGRSCELDKISQICLKHGLFLLEDCAHGMGGKFKDRRLGSIGDIGCFSFHAVKNLATGDGGMIVTKSKEFYDRLMRMRWLGITKDTYSRDLGQYSWFYDVQEFGFKYHMNDIIAAIGLAQFSKLEWMNDRRREISNKYDKELKDIGDIKLLGKKEYQYNAAHNYVIKTEQRDALNEYLKIKGISTGVHYYPNHLYEIYKAYYRECPVAEKEWKKLLTLPLYPSMTEEEFNMVIAEIKRFYNAG
jgi:perosamine synthetase